MNRRSKELLWALYGRLVMNSWTRRLLERCSYLKMITQSEAIIALRKREDKLDEFYWRGKLRHYGHALDKGLHRGDFSRGRGKRAYGLVKDALSHVSSKEGRRDPSVVWAARRIEQYEDFQTNESAGIVAAYIKTTCRHDDLLDAIRTRRSVRQYLDRPIDDETIKKIASVLDWSPTSCNRQPGRVYATSNPDLVRKCTTLHRGAACFTNIYAPMFLLFCADARLYRMPVEWAMPYVDVALGVQNCVLVAHTLGISLTLLTCATLGKRDERNLRKMFGIPKYFHIVVSAIGGYPNAGAEVPVRKNTELFLMK